MGAIVRGATSWGAIVRIPIFTDPQNLIESIVYSFLTISLLKIIGQYIKRKNSHQQKNNLSNKRTHIGISKHQKLCNIINRLTHFLNKKINLFYILII